MSLPWFLLLAALRPLELPPAALLFASSAAATWAMNPGGSCCVDMVAFAPSPALPLVTPTGISRSPTCLNTIRLLLRLATVALIASSLASQSG